MVIVFLLASAKAVIREFSDSFDLCRHLILNDHWSSRGWFLVALLHSSKKNYKESIKAINRSIKAKQNTTCLMAKNQRLRLQLVKTIILTKGHESDLAFAEFQVLLRELFDERRDFQFQKVTFLTSNTSIKIPVFYCENLRKNTHNIPI